ncbi:uncharacterized protein LOC121477727 isoform X2 [Vulpes lagopus]|uniref:uncharacterized protein LOC121477727 isoform X2 n=1 Tax=Vulpes lagopus TaxID=494514 RepID=UPI001BCA63FF|nr:uncharacterized protein LOC121477727 isoform X2 [Vulpes lagopus]
MLSLHWQIPLNYLRAPVYDCYPHDEDLHLFQEALPDSSPVPLLCPLGHWAEKTGIPRDSALAQGLKAAAGVDQDLRLPGACSTGGLTCSFRVGHLVSLCPNRGKTARRCGAMCWGLDGAGGKLIPGSGGPPIPTSLLSLLRVQNSFLFRVCPSRVEKELGPALCTTPRAKSLPGIISHKPAGTLMVFPSQIAGSAGGESWNTCSARQGPNAT